MDEDAGVDAPVVPQVTSCPCGTGRSYDTCCGRLHRGAGHAKTAVELMRSRYSAFVVRDSDYLSVTWHPEHRPSRVRFVPDQRWTGLEIHATAAGGLLDTAGTVEFTASYVNAAGTARQLHETSRFARLDGHWLYLSGDHL
jgi:SEC-C motif-containing protein